MSGVPTIGPAQGRAAHQPDRPSSEESAGVPVVRGSLSGRS
jgi:hypothetical protein